MWTLLAVAISACAFYISTGLGEFWPAAWVAPIPVLVLSLGSTRRRAALAAFAAYFLGSLNLFSYLAKVIPLAAVLAALAGPALVFAAVVLFTRYCVRRLPPWMSVFAFPAAWTWYEFLLSRLSPHGTSLSLAYSQTDFLPLLQLASIMGLSGITFLVCLLPSAAAVAWKRRSVRPLAVPLAIICVALGYGAVRLRNGQPKPAVRVGLAATDQGIDAAFQTTDSATALAVARAYAARAARLAAAGAQVVVLPEKLMGVTAADQDAIQQVFSEAARAAHVTLIAGLDRFTPRPPHNVATVIGPDGRIILEYEKHHLLPGPETGYVTGEVHGLFTAPGAQWAVAICKDMDFPGWLRAYGQRHVGILAVPAWDFVRDGRLHSRMAVVRGVENGFTIARVAQQGRLTFSDAYGRILAETSSSRIPEATLIADVPAGPGATVYSRSGDWAGWLAGMTLMLLVWRGAHRTLL